MEVEEEHPHNVPEEQRWAVVIHKKDGLSDRGAARMILLSYGRAMCNKTAKKIWDHYQATGNVDYEWSTTGRPRTITEEELNRLIESCRADRIKSVKERKSDLGLTAGRTTINQALLDHGFKAYKAPRKPVLTVTNIQDRYDFAREYQAWTEEDWSHVVFSDESAFRLVNSNGRVFIRRQADEAWEEDSYQAHAGQGRSVMVWGAISHDGPGPLVRFTETIDSNSYIEAFNNRIHRFYPDLYGGHLIFMQDNSPVHTSYAVQDWFETRNIELLDWPARSPDLNIIENVWGAMKYELRSQVFDDLEDLWHDVGELWDNFVTDEFIRSLYESLPRRIEAVVRARGKHTKY